MAQLDPAVCSSPACSARLSNARANRPLTLRNVAAANKSSACRSRRLRVFSGGNGLDTIYGQAGDDTIWGDAKDALDTGNAKDLLYGGDGRDTIYGGNGADVIYGDNEAAGEFAVADVVYNDTIYGDNGGDRIVGGLGADALTGGNGPDVFVYTSNNFDTVSDSFYTPGDPVASPYLDAARKSWDIITDFASGEDDIDLSALNAKLTGDGPATLVWSGATTTDADAGNSAASRAHAVWADDTHSFIYADIDGDGAADMKMGQQRRAWRFHWCKYHSRDNL